MRKYGDNDAEMGSEGTPADFLDALLDLTLEFRRVLAPHGSIAIELGDTYSGSGGAGGDYNPGGLRDGQERFDGSAVRDRSGRPDDSMERRDDEPPTVGTRSNARFRAGYQVRHPDGRIQGPKVEPYAVEYRGGGGGVGWPLAKSLALIPQLYPASLAYGRNLLRPEHTFAPWLVRNVITWCRPNPPVGKLGDKVRPATSYITVACTSGRRYFDLDGVRTEYAPITIANKGKGQRTVTADGPSARGLDENFLTHAGAPPLDWWDDALDPNDPTDHMTIVMPTQPYPGAHYATWPAKLAQRLIDMMCPLKVCVTCGKPSERITETVNALGHGVHRAAHRNHADGRDMRDLPRTPSITADVRTLGWSDCGCKCDECYAASRYYGNDPDLDPTPCDHHWRPGHVLDPFAGSGTTLAVAMGMGRDVTGIELYPANADLIRERVGMFLEEYGPTVSITETRPL